MNFSYMHFIPFCIILGCKQVHEIMIHLFPVHPFHRAWKSQLKCRPNEQTFLTFPIPQNIFV
jgi:hypothetical protein